MRERRRPPDASGGEDTTQTGRSTRLDVARAAAVSERRSRRKIDGATEKRMGDALGQKVPDVEIHVDDSSADAMGARAYADGKNLHFGPGEFKPGTKEGDRLLAHELAHVAAGDSGVRKKSKHADAGNDPVEKKADQAGDKAAGPGGETAPDPSTAEGAQAIVTKLQTPEAAKVVGDLGAPGRAQLATTLQTMGAAPQTLKTLFDLTPDGEIDTLGHILGARFQITVGPDTVKSDGKGIEWEPIGLRRAWSVLEALPPAHVAGNAKLWALVRYKVKKGSGAEGVYVEAGDKDEKVNQSAIGYDPEHMDDDSSAFADKGDPLHDVNAFNATVRHEVGHAVDAKVGASAGYCTTPAGGAWRQYDDMEPVVKDMLATSGGKVGNVIDPAAVEEISAALANVMAQQKFGSVEQQLAKGALWKKLDKGVQTSVLQSPVVQTIEKNTAANEPWMTSPLTIGGRCFQESYDKSWTSFAVEARDRKVSNYQFRAPGEWFAEAYSAYYEPTQDPAQKGAVLGGRDPKAKAFFDAVVDTAAPDASKGADKDKNGKTQKGSK